MGVMISQAPKIQTNRMIATPNRNKTYMYNLKFTFSLYQKQYTKETKCLKRVQKSSRKKKIDNFPSGVKR